MVTLHTWYPLSALDVIELVVPPDLGHSTLQVVDDSGQETYVSFWPDPTTLVGEISHHFHLPLSRFPPSYSAEICSDGHYMRRGPNRSDQINGLDESRIAPAWQFLSKAHYDLRYWNCSDVTKFLVLHAMSERYFAHIQDAARLTYADLHEISNFQQVRAIVRYLATCDYIDTRPDDVVHLVKVYNQVRAAEVNCHTEQQA